MSFVVDASVAASWLLPDESDGRAQAAFDRLDAGPAFAPSLWWFEIRNIFIVSERRGRLTAVQTQQALQLLSQLPIVLDHDADDGLLLALARERRLTVYDAAYLELALRRRAPMATLDDALARAALAAGVALVGP